MVLQSEGHVKLKIVAVGSSAVKDEFIFKYICYFKQKFVLFYHW